MRMLQFSESSHGARVEVRLNERFEICLTERPTAGYRWRAMSTCEPACTLLSSTFAPETALPGASGLHRWEYLAAQPGSCHIEFEYTRSWPSAARALRTFKLYVDVIE